MDQTHTHHKLLKAGSLVAILILIAALLIGNLYSEKSVVQDSYISDTGMYFDTVITIQLYDTSDTSLLEHCFSECSRYERLLSRTIPTSDVSRINQANGQPVTVSNETLALLKKGLYYSEISDGAFDITIAPLSTLWNFGVNEGTVPSSDDIQSALSHVDYHMIQIDGNTVTLADADAGIDLGGIAKGYIADQLKSYLLSQGIQHAIINLGGNVLTIGGKPDGSAFTIGIQKPFSSEGTAITTVELKDRSVVSSGVYERYFEVDGTRYHHILNPSTGYPYDNGLISVSIISADSVDGDGLSTTCFALGLEEGMKLIKSIPDTEAIFITDDDQLHTTY